MLRPAVKREPNLRRFRSVPFLEKSWKTRCSTSDELRQVMEDVQLLMKSKSLSTQKDIQMQLSWCLERLHAKLDESRALLRASSEAGSERPLEALDAELRKIKFEVLSIRNKLQQINVKKTSNLEMAMRELEDISFLKLPCFNELEKAELQNLYESFKEVTRSGEDGAVPLMHLIMKVRTYEDDKEGLKLREVQEIERTTLTKIFDIYASLFPTESETDETTSNLDPVVEDKIVFEPKETDSSGSQMNLDVPSEGQAFYEKPSSQRPIISRPADDFRVPEIPKSSLPKFAQTEKPDVSFGGGDGGGDNRGHGGDDGSDGEEGDLPGEGVGPWFLFLFGFLTVLLLFAIFLPEDKSEVAEKLSLTRLREWFQKEKVSTKETSKKTKKR